MLDAARRRLRAALDFEKRRCSRSSQEEAIETPPCDDADAAAANSRSSFSSSLLRFDLPSSGSFYEDVIASPSSSLSHSSASRSTASSPSSRINDASVPSRSSSSRSRCSSASDSISGDKHWCDNLSDDVICRRRVVCGGRLSDCDGHHDAPIGIDARTSPWSKTPDTEWHASSCEAQHTDLARHALRGGQSSNGVDDTLWRAHHDAGCRASRNHGDASLGFHASSSLWMRETQQQRERQPSMAAPVGGLGQPPMAPMGDLGQPPMAPTSGGPECDRRRRRNVRSAPATMLRAVEPHHALSRGARGGSRFSGTESDVSSFEGVFHFESETPAPPVPPITRRGRYRTRYDTNVRLEAPRPVSFSSSRFVSALNSSSDSESSGTPERDSSSDSDSDDGDYEIEFIDSPTPTLSLSPAREEFHHDSDYSSWDAAAATGSGDIGIGAADYSSWDAAVATGSCDIDIGAADAHGGTLAPEPRSSMEGLPRESSSSRRLPQGSLPPPQQQQEWSWSLLRPGVGRCGQQPSRKRARAAADSAAAELERRLASLKQQLSRAQDTETSLRAELSAKFRECAEISRRCADERARNQRLVADHAAELERASGGVEQSLGDLQKERDEAKAESAELRAAVDDKARLLAELRAQFTDHEALWETERDGLRKQIDAKSEDNAVANTLKRNLEARESELQEELDAEKARASSLEAELGELKAQVAALENDVISLTEGADSSSASLAESRTECDQLRSRLSDAEAKVKQLTQDAEEERAAAREGAEAYEKRIRDLEGEMSKSKVTEARTEDDFEKLRAELETLADAVRSEREGLQKEKAAHAELERSHAAVLDNLRAELKTSESMVEQRSKAITELTARLAVIDELQAKNAKLQSSLDESKKAREDLAAECDKVAVRLEENAVELHAAQTELVEQTEVAEARQHECDRSRERVANLTREVEAAKAEESKTRAELEALTAELAQRSSEVASVRSQLDAAREQTKNAETSNGELEGELEKLRATISSLEADAESMRRELDEERAASEAKRAEMVAEHEQACAQLESTITGLNKSLDEVRAENADASASLIDVKAKASRDLQSFELEKRNQDVTVKQLISKLAEVNGTSARQTEHITMLEEQVEEMHTLRAQLAELNASLEHLKGVEEDLQSQQKVNFAQREQIRSLSEEFDKFKQVTERVSKARRQETELLVSSVSVLKSTVESAQLSQLKYNSPESSLKDRLKFSEDMINRMLTEDIQLLNTNTFVLDEKEIEAVHLRQLCSSLLQELATMIMQINHQVTVSNFPSDFKDEARLKHQLYVVGEEHASLKAALTTAEDVKKHMFEQVRDKNSQLELISEQLAELHRSCDARQQKCDEAEREVLSLRKQLRELELLSAEAVDNVRELTIVKQHNEKLKKRLESEQLKSMDAIAAAAASNASSRRSAAANPSGSFQSSRNNSASYSSTSSLSSSQRSTAPSSSSSSSTNPFAPAASSTNPFGRPPSGRY